MSISNFYNKTVSLVRLVPVANSHREEWSVVRSIACHIQQSSAGSASLANGGFYNLFDLFCDSAEDITEGDRIVEGVTTYTVKGVKVVDYDIGSSNAHLEVSIVKGL